MPLDRVFGPECSTREVYDQGAKEVALSVVSGVHDSFTLETLRSFHYLQLNKEVFQLAQELERAYSRIEDLQQIIGEAPQQEILSTDSEQTNTNVR